MKICYKCACMAAEAEIEVMGRPAGGDILDWMQGVVQPSISVDHRARSPHCRAAALEYAKIPLDEAAPGIGMVPVKH